MCDIGKATQLPKYDLEISYFKMAKTTENIFFSGKTKLHVAHASYFNVHHMAVRGTELIAYIQKTV